MTFPPQPQWHGQPGVPQAWPNQQPAWPNQPVPPQAHGIAPPQGQPAWSGQPGFAQPAAPPGWHAAPAHPAVIDVGKSDSRRFVIASAVIIPLGAIAIIAGLVGAVEGGPGVAIGAICIGGVFLLIGLLPILARKRAFRPRQLVIEQEGIRWDDPQGRPWAVRWQELAAVALSKHEALQVGPESVSDKVSGAITDKMLGERALVRLDLFPADPGFHQRHPEMAHLWDNDRLRLPLGHNAGFLPQMDAAIRHFQPSRYLGVQQTEGFMGLR